MTWQSHPIKEKYNLLGSNVRDSNDANTNRDSEMEIIGNQLKTVQEFEIFMVLFVC